MKSKKLVKYILVVSVLILITISISYFVIAKSNKKNNIQSVNNLKLAASNDLYTLSKTISNHSFKFVYKKKVKSSIEKGCDYYGNIYKDGYLLKNYTWKLSNYNCIDSYSSNMYPESVVYRAIRDGSTKKTVYMLSVKPSSIYSSEYGFLAPTYVFFDSDYNFLYQIPYPSSLKIKIGSKTYDASNGVGYNDTSSYWYYEPSKEKPNIINKRIVKFKDGGVEDSISEELSGTVVSS